MNLFDQHRDALDQVRAIIPGLEEDAPLFHAPWQARIFALIVATVKQGHLPWKTFQVQLVKAITEKERGRSGDEEMKTDNDYFDCWLTAVEETLKHEGIIAGEDIGRKIEEIASSIAGIRAGQLSQDQQARNHD
ncbi:MAG: nitrile hydratase accessory protein [Gammaproteobacteria bacterium]|nr:nitrile hydratase accessory protein [Gammaproteobacteria bacterium]